MGKSRIIASLALILLLQKQGPKVHVIVPNAALAKRDSIDYKDYFESGGVQRHVAYHSDLNFHRGPSDILLFDEADDFILRKPQLFLTGLKGNKLVCFTATP